MRRCTPPLSVYRKKKQVYLCVTVCVCVLDSVADVLASSPPPPPPRFCSPLSFLPWPLPFVFSLLSLHSNRRPFPGDKTRSRGNADVHVAIVDWAQFLFLAASPLFFFGCSLFSPFWGLLFGTEAQAQTSFSRFSFLFCSCGGGDASPCRPHQRA